MQFETHAKGKVERGVSYVRANALKGRRFKSLSEENLFLKQWESQVADKRIHGTTRKQVATCFEEERPHLQPLADSLFPCFQEARRNVHRDSYVEVARAFYEVPAELIGRQVWVRWDSRCVRIFNDRMEQMQIHTRVEPGQFSHVLGARGLHAPSSASMMMTTGRLGPGGTLIRRGLTDICWTCCLPLAVSRILPLVRRNKASLWTDCAFVRLSGNLRFSEKRQETSTKQPDSDFLALISGRLSECGILSRTIIAA